MDINTCLATTIDYRDLALFSHLIPAAAALILGLFAVSRSSDRHKALIFLTFTGMFATWLLFDLIVWTTNSYAAVAAFWAPLDYIETSFFLVLFYFVYIDFFKKDNPALGSLIILAATVPFFITLSGNAVHEFYQPVCEMEGNGLLAQYKVWLEAAILLGILCMGVYRIRAVWLHKSEVIRLALITLAIVLFMGVFGGSEFVATSTDIFEINLYALFTLPLFILMLTMAITSYGTFHLGDASVKMLFYVFLVLAATQFFFVTNMTDFLLALMSFCVVLTLGVLLYRISEREINQRHTIEHQAHELEVVNRQQENLLHFMSHEVKGYLGKGEAAFAGIVQGDYGKTTQKLAVMAKAGLEDARRGVDMVSDILDASNLRKGTMSYAQTVFDLKESVERVVEKLTPAAESHGLTLVTNINDGNYSIKGDEAKFRRHVVRNLIDNAIRYTPSGSITVDLKAGNSIIFAVTDTGVGITDEDKTQLFTEGGHGKESTKVNIDSTGYGLYIAKQVAEAHGGTIRADSKGRGKGSTFTVEMPRA